MSVDASDFLLEIGCGELPPKALKTLATALHDAVITGIKTAELSFESSKAYAAPRRLAVWIKNLSQRQPEQAIERRGPALNAAYDADHQPTSATLGFARSCGVAVSELTKLETDKGAWLVYRAKHPGKTASALLPAICEQAILRLPISKPMRWGDSETLFIRPVYWVVLLHGKEVIPAHLLGQEASNQSYGHRYLYPENIVLQSASDYLNALQDGFVMVDREARREHIQQAVQNLAKIESGVAIIDSDLLDEVTAIVEWPVPLLASFDKKFLKVPKEALMSAIQQHQKCFPVVDAKGNLLPHFITVANIQSRDPKRVIAGNERVMRARLADAEFFYETDLAYGLENYAKQLNTVIFQEGLGTLSDKQTRIKEILKFICDGAAKPKPGDLLSDGARNALLAAELCKADLMSTMVGEFPELQGIMGAYYATHSGKNKETVNAIREHYLPRQAEDELPKTLEGSALAIADRFDTIVSFFKLGKMPTGDKDPFGLRRSALGLLKIIVDCTQGLDLGDMIEEYGDDKKIELKEFFFERLHTIAKDRGISSDIFAAVKVRGQLEPDEFFQRLKAVQVFKALSEARNLVAALKRVRNILKQNSGKLTEDYQDPESVVQKLIQKLRECQKGYEDLLKKSLYVEALKKLSTLKDDIDEFFEKVLVMHDDVHIRQQRLGLLVSIEVLFLGIADCSLLQF